MYHRQPQPLRAENVCTQKTTYIFVCGQQGRCIPHLAGQDVANSRARACQNVSQSSPPDLVAHASVVLGDESARGRMSWDVRHPFAGFPTHQPGGRRRIPQISTKTNVRRLFQRCFFREAQHPVLHHAFVILGQLRPAG